MAENDTPDVVASGATSTAVIERGSTRKFSAREIKSQVEDRIQSLQPSSLSIDNATPEQQQAHTQAEASKSNARREFVDHIKASFNDEKIQVAQDLKELAAGKPTSAESQDTLVSTVQMVTAASRDLIEDIDPSSKAVLVAMNEKVVGTMTKEAAVATHGLVDQLLSGPTTIDGLKNQFQQIKNTYQIEKYLTDLSDALVSVKNEIGLGDVEDDFIREHYFNPKMPKEGESVQKTRQELLLEQIDALKYDRPANYDSLSEEAREVYDKVGAEIAEQQLEIIQKAKTNFELMDGKNIQIVEAGPRADQAQKMELLEATRDVLTLVAHDHIPVDDGAKNVLFALYRLGPRLGADAAPHVYELVHAAIGGSLQGEAVIALYDNLAQSDVSQEVLKVVGRTFIEQRASLGLTALSTENAETIFSSQSKKATGRETLTLEQKAKKERDEFKLRMAQAVNADGSANIAMQKEMVRELHQDILEINDLAEYVKGMDAQNAFRFEKNDDIRAPLTALVEVMKTNPNLLEGICDVRIAAFAPAIEQMMKQANMYPHVAAHTYAYLNSFVQALTSADTVSTELLEQSARKFKQASYLMGDESYAMVEGLFGQMKDVVESGTFGRDVDATGVDRIFALKERGVYEAKVVRDQEFERDWEHYYRSYYGPDLDVKNIVQAIYSVDNFEEYYTNIETEIRELPEFAEPLDATAAAGEQEKHKMLMAQKLRQAVSEKIEADIISIYGGLFQDFDYKRPSEFFENQMSEGYMDSIANTKIRIDKVMGQLIASINRDELDTSSPARNALFFKRATEQELFEVRVEKGKGSDAVEEDVFDTDKKSIMQYRTMPTAGYKDNIDLAEFLNYARGGGQTMIDIRGFNHNVQAILLNPGGKSPWESLKGYAEKMRATDIDSIWMLPDAEKWKEANAIYIRMLRYEFAKLDYRHSSVMFSPDNEQRTKIQQATEAELKRVFPELADGKNQARLKLAVSMGVGLSQGVLLNEVELAAYADPAINVKDGSATFRSQYYNDGTMLGPLNDAHNKVRFQSDSTQALWHMLVELNTPEAKRLMRRFDHTLLFEGRTDFYESLEVGGGRLDDKGKTFIDRFCNYAGIGGWLTRASSWRMESATEGLMVREQGTGKTDPIKTWQSMENVGVEPLKWYLSNSAELKELIAHEHTSEQQEFFEGLYTKHIQPFRPHVVEKPVAKGAEPAVRAQTYHEYMKEIEVSFEQGIAERLSNGTISKEDAQKQQKAFNPREKFMWNTLAYMRFQRDPTTIINFERDRLSYDGTRAMEKIRRNLAQKAELQLSGKEDEGASKEVWGDLTDWEMKAGDTTVLDRSMHNLMVVSSVVRQETSDKMKDHLRLQSIDGKSMSLADFSTDDYRVDASSIDRVLRTNLRYEAQDEDGKKAIEREILQTIQLHKAVVNYNIDTGRTVEKGLVERYADKWKEGDLRFSQGAEELDMSFLAIKNNGERTLPRLMGEIHTLGEEKVMHSIHELPEVLAKAARTGSHDEIVQLIKVVKEGVTGVHSPPKGTQIAMDLAILTTSYFKKDFGAISPVLTFLRGDRRKPHSFAAEIAGTSDRVWEWDNIDSYNFAMALEAEDILPRHAENLADRSAKVIVDKNGRKRIEIKHDHGIKTSMDFRKAVGADPKGIARDLLIKFGPLAAAGAAALVIALMIKAAKKESKGR